MEYHLTWLATIIVLLIAIVVGAVTAMAFRNFAGRNLWALLVALVFVGAACTSVIFDYSWLYTDAERIVPEALALGALVTGLTYAARAPR